ncbi:GGDEF domain-containing protein, partial [Oleiphilus sp. HI0066]|uniref:GGDEF domain-containing protein n=3 Tax=Oleiphilus TaxID=141450 RepID=UPI000AC28C5D
MINIFKITLIQGILKSLVSAGKSKRDISKEVSLCEKLVKEATHDQLTGLSTRRKLEEFVNMLISSSHRSNRLFAILFIDLNNFKPINDLHGHEAGEAVLKSIAKRISALTRQEDLCARIGGDEFVVVISELKNNSKLKFITARYASELSKNIAYEDYSISISATTFPADGKDYTSLIQHADR